MAVRAADRITLATLPAPSYVRMYYLLQASTLTPPAAPSTNPPPAPWTTTEPTYTAGSTNTLYTVMLTAYGELAFEYGPVQKSSAYEAAKQAYNKAQAAENAATTADGRVTVSANAPTTADGEGKPVGAVWFRKSGSTFIGVWEWTGTAPWASRTLTDATIANLNAGKINAGTLNAARIGANAITSEKINASAVGTEKLTALAVTADKLAANAVTADKIVANAVGTEKLAAEAVTAEKIVAGAVGADQLAANAVTAEKLVAGAITAEKLAAGSVTAEKVAAGALTAREVSLSVANLIPDPHFEKADPGYPAGAAWAVTEQGATTEITTTEEGPTLHVASGTGTTASMVLSNYTPIPVAPGEVLHLSFRGKNVARTSAEYPPSAIMYVYWLRDGARFMEATPTGSVYAMARLALGGGPFAGSQSHQVPVSTDWTTLAMRAIVPEGVDGAEVVLGLQIVESSKSVWLASPRVTREGSAAVKFFDGSGDLAASMSGVAGTSESRVLLTPEAGSDSVGFRATAGTDLILETDSASVSVNDLAPLPGPIEVIGHTMGSVQGPAGVWESVMKYGNTQPLQTSLTVDRPLLVELVHSAVCQVIGGTGYVSVGVNCTGALELEAQVAQMDGDANHGPYAWAYAPFYFGDVQTGLTGVKHVIIPPGTTTFTMVRRKSVTTGTYTTNYTALRVIPLRWMPA